METRDRLVNGEFDPNGLKDGDLVNAPIAFTHILPKRREDIIGCGIAILTDDPKMPYVRITGSLEIVDCNLNYRMVTYRVVRY